MRVTRLPVRRRPMLHAVAVAAAATLMTAAPDARAQSFTQSGANSTSPNNLLPFVGSPTSLDFGTDSVYIGNSGVGSFSALNGALFKAGSLSLGNGGTGIGTTSFVGAGTQVELGANLNRLEIGNWGTGTLTVSAGALLDAAVSPGNCSNCWNVIGNTAGSTGTLTITGAGSEVRTLRGFAVGTTWVSPGFGTPGGTTNAFLNVLAGGTLRSEAATVAGNFGGPNSNGQEKVNGTVVVSGTGSQWIVGRNSVDNGPALLGIGSGAGVNALVTVSNGGKLQVDGTGSVGPNDGINVGSGGKGKLTVTGTGSLVMTGGVNHFINVGANNSLGDGTFEILAGAAASTLYLNVGRNGGTGTMLIDGVGSTLTQSGVGVNQSPGLNGAAGASIGRNTNGNGGTGSVIVSNGGQWIISDGGGDGRVSQASPGLSIGRGANSTGSLTITGAGSKVEINTTSLNPGAGVGDNHNPFVAVGFDNPATSSGELTISAGGKLVMNGNAVSTVANSRSTQLNIGGRSGTAGKGTATVTGAGSEILMTGYDAFINVGREAGSTGVLNVLAGGKITTTSLPVGVSASGTVNIDNATVALVGDRSNVNPPIGAGATIGRGTGGVGALNMTNGARFTITPGVYGGGMSIGGDQFLSGGNGTVTMSGGSSIVTAGGAGINVGWTGTGSATLNGASLIDVGTGSFSIAGAPPTGQPVGNGALALSSGSKLTANVVNIGGNSDTDVGGIGSATVSGLGSELRAAGPSGFIGVGRSGTGALTVEDQAKVSAIVMSVGRSPGGQGVLTANNATFDFSGQQTTGNLSGAGLTIGTGEGNGVASFAASRVNITNPGSDGAFITIGGSGNFPGGTGTLAVTGGSEVRLTAGSGQARINVGRTGSGTAIIDSSLVDVGDGGIYVGRYAGSTGTMIVSNGSTINAGYVGVGTSQPYDGNVYNGGTGILVLNDSTINTGVFELGANGILTGNNGTIDAVGDVIIGGTINPGNSPGRIRIMCNVIMLAGSKIILEVSGGPGNYQTDQLIIGNDATFDLASAEIVFSFLDNTNPNEAAAAGVLNLDNLLRTAAIDAPIDGPTQALSTRFTGDQTWSDVISTAKISAVSTEEAFKNIRIEYAGNGQLAVLATPEPATWGTLFLGLCAVGAVARQRRASARSA